MLRKPVLLVVTLAVFSGGCESTATTPTNGGTNIVATGPQVLRILSQSPCTQLVPGVLPQVHTRVNVVMSSTEWVATAADAAAGDIQIRFRQSGQSMISGSMPVAGTVTGTGIHAPQLFPGPAWNVQATFGGSASLTGVAFVAGVFGATSNGIDGVGTGSLTLTDAIGNTCAGTTFSWSVFPSP